MPAGDTIVMMLVVEAEADINQIICLHHALTTPTLDAAAVFRKKFF